MANYIKEMEGIDAAPLADLPDSLFEKNDTTLSLGDDRYTVWVHLWTTKGPSAYSLIIDFEPGADGYEAHFENLETM